MMTKTLRRNPDRGHPLSMTPIAVLVAAMTLCAASVTLAGVDAGQAWQTETFDGGAGPTARHESGLAAANGQLWLFGGRGDRPVEAWSPDSDRWRTVGPMPADLHHFQPAVIGTDIYIVGALEGGYPREDPVVAIHRFDTVTESWDVIGEVPADRRRGSAATAVRGEWIYIVAGNTLGHSGGAVGWLDRYRPRDGAWERLADAPNPRDHFSAAFAAGKLVAAGGRATAVPNPFDGMIATTDVYDPDTDSWRMAADIPTLRAGTLAIAACDEVIVAGGESEATLALDRVESYDAATDRWRRLQPLGQGRHSGGGARLGDRFHTVAGGSTKGGGNEQTTHEFLQLPVDTDCDGLVDRDETDDHGSDPQRTDTDGDGLTDAREVELGTDPTRADTDEDGLDDADEIDAQTDPLDGDTDGDGLMDGAEIDAGTDPLVADRAPEGTDPPVTDPPVTDPPVTDPPITAPPVTAPPVTTPPITTPPVTDPPVTSPPVTNPPVTTPPVTNPPDATDRPPVESDPEPVEPNAPARSGGGGASAPLMLLVLIGSAYRRRRSVDRQQRVA